MIAVDDIRKQAERAYPDYLRSLVTGEPFFPLDVRFGKGIRGANYQAFKQNRDALLKEAADVMGEADSTGRRSCNNGYIVELESRTSRRYGLQSVPSRIYFPDGPGYAGFLGRRDEVERFREAVGLTGRDLPALLPWLAQYPTRATTYLDRWEDLLRVCLYFLEHPRPNLYARELPIPVPTKFVEDNEGVLRQMLDFLLPDDAIETERTDFARRFGLRYDEPRVRIRVLDANHLEDWPATDLSFPISQLAALDVAGSTVIISENKMTFLAMPRIKKGLAFFGGGFQIELLRMVHWLRKCDVLYWGDLDAHGFMILSQLRSFLPGARSVMMDVETVEAFREFAVMSTPADVDALPHLTPQEQAVFQSLVRMNLRLEQERIPHSYVARALAVRAGQSSRPRA